MTSPDIRDLAVLLGYPDFWVNANLLPQDLCAAQWRLLMEEGGSTDAPEHYRYGAFHHWLKRNPPEDRLAQLVEAAALDPDRPMAGAALTDIVSSSGSTAHILALAVEVAARSDEFSVTPQILEERYHKSR